jgi:hypothetical protein
LNVDPDAGEAPRSGDWRGDVQVTSSRKTALYAGLFIGAFVFSIPAALLYDPVLNDADYILGDGADTRISLGAFLEILSVTAAQDSHPAGTGR